MIWDILAKGQKILEKRKLDAEINATIFGNNNKASVNRITAH